MAEYHVSDYVIYVHICETRQEVHIPPIHLQEMVALQVLEQLLGGMSQ